MDDNAGQAYEAPCQQHGDCCIASVKQIKSTSFNIRNGAIEFLSHKNLGEPLRLCCYLVWKPIYEYFRLLAAILNV